MLLFLQTSYAQLIFLPWDTGVCRGCRAEVPITPHSTANEVKAEIQLTLIQDGLESPEVEIIGLSNNPTSQSGILQGRYAIIIRSKNVIVLTTTIE